MSKEKNEKSRNVATRGLGTNTPTYPQPKPMPHVNPPKNTNHK